MVAEQMIFPDKNDTQLLQAVMQAIEEQYPARFSDVQKKDAFVATCQYYDDALTQKRFIKRAVMTCFWNRPLIAER